MLCWGTPLGIRALTVAKFWQPKEKQMLKLTLTLAALACTAIAAPAFASDGGSAARSSLQLANAQMLGPAQAIQEFSAAGKKKAKKKGAVTSRKSWGG
jgi:hypothetical protein